MKKYKKLLLIGAVLVSTVTPLHAQTEGSRVNKWSIMPHVGISFAHGSFCQKGYYSPYYSSYGSYGGQSSYHYDKSENGTGIALGADVEYQYHKLFSTTLGFNFSSDKFDDRLLDKKKYCITALENMYVLPHLALKTGFQLVNLDESMELPLGISYEYCNFVLDCRYNFHLFDLKDQKEKGTYETKHSALWLSLGYKFYL